MTNKMHSIKGNDKKGNSGVAKKRHWNYKLILCELAKQKDSVSLK